ncbi:MAG: hypothetical protein ACRBG0_15935 [Lewinella sp.]|uniref:hypothetical protein n=1 Tax=Lewinella sp. TaxID=2004506 RepID=UPI003D6B2D4B
MRRNWTALNKLERKHHLENIELKNVISIPESIKTHCIEVACVSSNGLRNRLSQAINEDDKIFLQYEITEVLASEIIDHYNLLSDDEIDEIINLDKQDLIKQYSGILEYLLIEGISFYHHEKDEFNHSVLQEIYSKSNIENGIIITWIMSMDCGGFEGIILNTDEKECLSIGSYGQFQSITENGIVYEYYKHKRLVHSKISYLEWCFQNANKRELE